MSWQEASVVVAMLVAVLSMAQQIRTTRVANGKAVFVQMNSLRQALTEEIDRLRARVKELVAEIGVLEEENGRLRKALERA